MAVSGSEVNGKNTVETRILRVRSGSSQVESDRLVVEEPLEIAARNEKGLLSLGTAFRTPGDDEALAIGMLYNEGVIRGLDEVKELRIKTESDATIPVSRIIVEVADSVDTETRKQQRAFPISAACGACGKSAMEALRIQRVDAFDPGIGVRVSGEVLNALPARLRVAQFAFEKTGGLHAASRFDEKGELLDLAEDVGRHNAMDKLVGRWLKSGAARPWDEQLILFSGRVGYDLMQKALAVGCPLVASVGAPSSFAVELATLYRLTLVGFVRDGRFNVYSAPHRIAVS